MDILTTKGLQERNTTVGWDDGGKIGRMHFTIFSPDLPERIESGEIKFLNFFLARLIQLQQKMG